ncbi:phage tail tip lysozyme [Streptococcus pseudoporcinus]|uniref:CHAP domain containing protein n=1 Tax=Streptococcus pseudoporcinus TaxID=361101 RepID=A0A4U9XK60_9STRE|nr:phage tail tip lysozyme [Streptococcus pseudoporcinus]VTS12898.1 CHAP domain containing protein [Streptococcus pseudoporcinus]VUC65941.1 CHAP domain containing protein [Streptococcus pseudoporcinus]VUC96865.1 CHAP domain containing protein [Streptococcus pseudoporcinus]VUC97256.1 CHAP domain containing protein [Streptococcus pseudoporcinus]
MTVTKQELKRARLTKKTNLRQGRRTYRLKRQEARQNFISQSGRRGFLFHRLVSSKSPAQVAYQETVSSAKKEFDDLKEEEDKRFDSLLSSANPYDLSHQELKHHRLTQAKTRHKQARQHLKAVKEKETAKRKLSDQVNQAKHSRFFYQAKSLDRLQAEQEVSQSKQDLKQVKAVTRHKSPKTKLKRAGRYLGREVLYLASQDDDLAGARELVDSSYQVARYTRTGIDTGKAAVKLSKEGTRFIVQRARNTKERYQNWRAGKGFSLKKKENQLAQRFKHEVARRANQTRSLGKIIQSLISSFKQAFMALMGNPVTWIVSGFLLFLLLMMSFFLGFASQTLIQQDEFELTKAYTHMTWEDAEQTRTSEKGITYYTKVDDIMAYMNTQFQDYVLEDRISVLPPSITYKDYLSTLWQDLNGDGSLKTMSDLYDKPPYQLSKEEQDDLKELSEEGIYASLQELENPFEGQSEDDSLSMSYRYGYYHLDGKPTLQDFIILEAPSEQVIVAPLDGTVEIDGGDLIITAGKKASQVKLRLYGIHTGRLGTGQKVSAGEIIGQTKDGSGLKVSYQKYDPDEKSLVSVNPAFYFPKVVQLQTTILPHIGQFGGDEFERAKAIYTYLKAKGATNQAIAAILGNWSVESGINPKRAEGDYLSPPVGATETSWDDPAWLSLGGPAIYNGGYPNIIHRGLGLGQWTDTADGSRRHTLLLEYAKRKGKPWYDLELQLDFMLEGDNPYYTNWLNGFFQNTGSPASLAQVFLTYWEGNSGDKLLERQTRATEWYYQIEKGFSQPNGGTAQSDPAALEAVRGDLFDNSIPGGGDGMGYAYGQCTWGVAARINQLGLKLKGRNGERIPITSVMGNGQDWVGSASALGGETGSMPQAGAIISFAGGSHGTPIPYGHVAFVEKVYPDGSFLISETNVNGNPNYTFRKISGVDAAMSFAYTVK